MTDNIDFFESESIAASWGHIPLTKTEQPHPKFIAGMFQGWKPAQQPIITLEA